MELEPLSPYEEKKWDEHKRMLDSQTNRVKIFESPDGGKTEEYTKDILESLKED